MLEKMLQDDPNIVYYLFWWEISIDFIYIIIVYFIIITITNLFIFEIKKIIL